MTTILVTITELVGFAGLAGFELSCRGPYRGAKRAPFGMAVMGVTGKLFRLWVYSRGIV